MSKTILYIDDEPWFVGALIDVLRDDGYAVEIVINGIEAIKRLSQKTAPLDLVVLDVIMPFGKDGKDSNGGRRTGLRIHEAIRKDLKLRIPVIFVSVVDDPVVERAILDVERRFGIMNYAYLVKPVLPTELLEKVSTMLQPSKD